tara:strand:- start:835 stop:996 length:162 start_codon:yes stop_codon:yes gene_type:complete
MRAAAGGSVAIIGISSSTGLPAPDDAIVTRKIKRAESDGDNLESTLDNIGVPM